MKLNCVKRRWPAFVAVIFFSNSARADWPIAAAAPPVSERLVTLRYTGVADGNRSNVQATGIILSQAAGRFEIVTSLHGLGSEPAGILVLAGEGVRVGGSLAGRDFTLGLALIEINIAEENARTALAGLLFSRIGVARQTLPGQTAVAIGRSLGDPSLSVGVVSGIRGDGVFVQTDASVSPLNYGGVLGDLSGDVYGLLAPRAVGPLSGADLYDSGIGFAVAWPNVVERTAKLREKGDLYPGSLNAEFASEDPLRAPAVLESMSKEGAATLAGLREGDTITRLNGRVCTAFQLRRRLALLDAGDTVSITYTRAGGRPKTVELTLGRITTPADR